MCDLNFCALNHILNTQGPVHVKNLRVNSFLERIIRPYFISQIELFSVLRLLLVKL